MSQACWGWLQMQIWKVDGYVWQLNAISRHAPNHGKVCRRREEMPPSGRCSGSFHSFSEAEYVTRACHVDDNTLVMLGRQRKNSIAGQRAQASPSESMWSNLMRICNPRCRSRWSRNAPPAPERRRVNWQRTMLKGRFEAFCHRDLPSSSAETQPRRRACVRVEICK